MTRNQQQLEIATRALGQAVEASCRASHLVLHGQDASQQHAIAENLQLKANAEWQKVELLEPESTH